MDQNINGNIRKLVTALSSPDDLTRVKARRELVATGKPALPLLVEALRDPNYLVRWEAVKALGEIGDPETSPALVKALEDEEFEVRWLAAKGLVGMNVKGLKPLFEALIQRADSAFLREGAHHVLHDLAKGELRPYLAPVLIALEDFEPTVQVPRAALHAMETLEKFLKTAHERNGSLLRQLTVAMPSQIEMDFGAHKRVRRYARSLYRV
jgi:HEAT repeat protein